MCDTEKIYELQEQIYNPHSRFHPSNEIHDTAIIYDCVTMGKNNKIGAYCVIGANGEIRNCKDFKGGVTIGDGNVISELVTIQRPALKEAETVIGNNNIIMAHAHVGHDVKIGNDCEICTGVILGGYSEIQDGAKLKLGVTVRNRKKVGKNTLVGLGSAVVKDIESNKVVFGNPAKEKI
jgi:UDP-N-acetylglucosamine acyltransferase